MRAGEPLSSDDEDGGVGMGLRMLQLMKEGSRAEELIEAFQEALEGPPPPLELEGGIYVAPAEGSTEVYWAPVEVEMAGEQDRIDGRRREVHRDRRAVAMKKMKGEKASEMKELVLEQLGIDDAAAESVCRSMATCTAVESLSLSFNKIGPLGCAKLVDMVLPSLSALTRLSLAYNCLGNEGARLMAHGLYDHSSRLATLELHSNMIGPNFPDELMSLSSLTSLSLRGNLIETAPRGLAAAFDQLDLSDNTPQLVAQLAAELLDEARLAQLRNLRKQGEAALAAAWKSWERLEVGGARRSIEAAARALEEAGASEEASVQMRMGELKSAIDLREQALGVGFVVREHDMTQLMASQSVERALRSLAGGACQLSMCNQMVGDSGVASIAKQLEDKGNLLTWLDLSRCDVGPAGAKELADRFLAKTVSLKTLWLNRNRLGDEGAAQIARGLLHNTSLAKLDLEHNNVRGKGVMALAHALKANPSFRALCVSFNWVGDQGGEEVAAALKNMRNLQEVDLSGSGVGRRGSEALSREFKTHQGILNGKIWR